MRSSGSPTWSRVRLGLASTRSFGSAARPRRPAEEASRTGPRRRDRPDGAAGARGRTLPATTSIGIGGARLLAAAEPRLGGADLGLPHGRAAAARRCSSATATSRRSRSRPGSRPTGRPTTPEVLERRAAPPRRAGRRCPRAVIVSWTWSSTPIFRASTSARTVTLGRGGQRGQRTRPRARRRGRAAPSPVLRPLFCSARFAARSFFCSSFSFCCSASRSCMARSLRHARLLLEALVLLLLLGLRRLLACPASCFCWSPLLLVLSLLLLLVLLVCFWSCFWSFLSCCCCFCCSSCSCRARSASSRLRRVSASPGVERAARRGRPGPRPR